MEFIEITEELYPQIALIYQQGIDSGIATFEMTAPDYAGWNQKYLPHSRIALINSKIVLGWAALAPVSKRAVYNGVAEVSIYIAKDQRGKGIGKSLFQELIKSSESAGIYSLQSSVFPENLASIKLHKTCGFREIGYKEKIAMREGMWFDNILLERRSKVIGI